MTDYIQFIKQVKQNILHSRYMAAKLANREQLLLYLRIGKMISEEAERAAWGAKVLQRISDDLQQELPGLRGFSANNMKKMRFFYSEWEAHLQIGSTLPNQLQKKDNEEITISSIVLNQLQINEDLINLALPSPIGSSLMTQFADSFLSLGFSLHYLILSKTKSLEERLFYIQKTAQHFWSFRVLEKHIKDNLYQQQGKLPNNFEKTLPQSISNKAVRMFKDEYLWDFINTEDEDDEREVENEIVRNIKKFIMSLGSEFAFLGNQYRLIVDEQELYIDLLFFQRKLQCLVAFELKTGKFKAEYAGKMNLYLSALDEYVKQPHENPSIGIILCKSKSDKFVEFAFRDINKPMGVATYRTSEEIPSEYRDALPDMDKLRELM